MGLLDPQVEAEKGDPARCMGMCISAKFQSSGFSTGFRSGRMGGMCLLWKGDTRTWDRVSETGPWSVEHLPLLSQDIKLWPFSWACAMKDLPSSFGANSFTIRLSAPSNHKHCGCLLSVPGCILWTQRWVRLWALPWELTL